MTSKPSGLLLLGTSLVGKSTCAEVVGHGIGWPVVSTDGLSRHPGRPWMGAPEQVLEYYLRLTDDTIHWFLRVHHENMRPLIRNNLEARREADGGFIMEGAALRPEYLSDYETGGALAVCLHIEPEVLRRRIEHESAYAQREETLRIAIEKFAERCVRENDALIEAAVRHDVLVVDVTRPADADRLAEDLLRRL